MRRVILLLIGVGLLVFLVVHLGTEQIAVMLKAVGWGFVGIVLLSGAHQLARAAALWACVPRGHAVSYLDAVLIRLSGEAIRFLTFTGPFLAEPTKAWLFKVRGLTVIEGFAATVTEYVAYTLLSATMAMTAVTYLLLRSDLGPEVAAVSILIPTLLAAGVIAAIVTLARGAHPIAGIVRVLAGLPLLRGRWQPNLESIRQVECRLQRAIHERPGALYAVLFDALGLPAAAGVTMAFVRRLRTLLVAGAGLLALSTLLGTRSLTSRPGDHRFIG